MHFNNTNRNQAPKCIRNTSPTPAGHELINTVVQVGAQGENKLNKRSRSLHFYRFGGLCPRPPLFLLLSFPHVYGRSGKIDLGAVERVGCCFSYRARPAISAILAFYCKRLIMWPSGKRHLTVRWPFRGNTYLKACLCPLFHLYKRFKLNRYTCFLMVSI